LNSQVKKLQSLETEVQKLQSLPTEVKRLQSLAKNKERHLVPDEDPPVPDFQDQLSFTEEEERQHTESNSDTQPEKKRGRGRPRKSQGGEKKHSKEEVLQMENNRIIDKLGNKRVKKT
jgi:hypothetical protein